MKCKHCGVSNDAGITNCKSCGAELAAPSPAKSMNSDVVNVAQREGKIAAIKHYRETRNTSLKDAKKAVEAILKEQGIELPGGSGCFGMLLIPLGLLTYWVLSLVVLTTF